MTVFVSTAREQDVPSAEVEEVVEFTVTHTGRPPGTAIDAPEALANYRGLCVTLLRHCQLPVPSDGWLDEFIAEMVAWHRDDGAAR